MKRTLMLAVLFASSMLAEQVFMSQNGKTYHAKVDCGLLKRSAHVYAAERLDADGHGLKQCRSCYKQPGAAKSVKNAWGKELPPKADAKAGK